MRPVVTILLLMSLLSFLGCGHKTPDPGPEMDSNVHLKKIHFSATHGYHAYSNIGYSAELTDDGKTRVIVEVGDDRDRVFMEDGSLMDSLEAIVREYRMNRYEGYYRPDMEILDGDSWSMEIDFTDGSSSSCGGYMAYPPYKGREAIGKVEGFLSRWLYQEPAEEVALVSFRYEWHGEDGDEVYTFQKKDGARYENMATKLANIIRWDHMASYTGEKLAEEDTTRPRWILTAEYENGQRIEAMDYLDRKPDDRHWRQGVPSCSEMSFRNATEQAFSEEKQQIEESADRLQSFYHTATHGYRGFTNRGYRAERLKGGKARLTIELGDDRDRVFETDDAILDALEELITQYRMDKYKERYLPKFDVKDGDNWEVSFEYSDGKYVHSDGYFTMPKGANEAFDKVEALFAPWRDREPDTALVSFRYELHSKDEGTEVFWFKKDAFHNAVYFRLPGTLEGWNYYCGDEKVLEKLDKEMRYIHACSYCGEDLSREDESRPRWVAILEYADGSKFELMDYLDRDGGYNHRPPTTTERVIRYAAENYFKEEIERIGNLPPEKLGEHSRTTYKANGKPGRTINYAGDGTVLNGHDYDDPMADF